MHNPSSLPANGGQAGHEDALEAGTRTDPSGNQQSSLQLGRAGSLRAGRQGSRAMDSSVHSGRFSLHGGRDYGDSSVHSGRYSLRGGRDTLDSSTHSSRQEHYDQALRQEYVLEALSLGPSAIGHAADKAV